MNIHQMDLNLLIVFEAMLEHQSVTRAGQAVGLSQPAMSAALSKLRTMLNDPLFVRTGARMKPTPHAQRLAPSITRMLHIMRTEVLQETHFDASISKRTITINTPDLGEMVFLPKLFKRLSVEAPEIRLQSITLPPIELEEALEAGEVDLSIGYYPDLTKAEIYQQRLFSHSFVCIVRADHPAVPGKTLSMEQFLALAHMVVYVEGRSHEIFEYMLHQRGIRRKIALKTRHFMSLPMIIEETDLIATVPRAVGIAYAKNANLKLLELPMKVPKYDLKQYWHVRFHKDEVNMWLRGIVRELFRG